ncbi:GDP-L-fucose synthase [Vibrio mangrovi]|uniref:GDP-L-fucose synthase n=1 Tax=Vibrio mangrovi TaxID=474394 RepID=A0A1Y6IV47_9VIBR|nr:GDP-L-fucose synthase [Vibrio mangrovi]MDW6002163.1 GDP-L-fucose synthase [Vibrio mangrovi]SMS01508.1 GDP-L-fucose synthase [Vibrio mangrovi]
MVNFRRVFVAGHNGMVGSAIVRQLQNQGYQDIITRSSQELDLRDSAKVAAFFSDLQIDEVYLAAAKVGGIQANETYPAEFIYDNLMIESNVIHQACIHGVKKLLFLGSSCIYPKLAEQPMRENELLNGYLEPTNEPYAIAKIAGIKLCESYNRQYGVDFRSVMPTNLYGPGDNYHPENSHVVPALIRRIHEAKQAGLAEVVIWGTGSAKREFLHVDDMAKACIFVMNLDKDIYQLNTQPMLSHINIGTGLDCTILELAEIIAKIIDFKGKIKVDPTKPDGTPRKLMNVGRLRDLGWKAQIDLESGLTDTYQWFREHQQKLRGM